MITLKDYLYYYQRRAFGKASINERSQVAHATGVQLTLVTGAVLETSGIYLFLQIQHISIVW